MHFIAFAHFPMDSIYGVVEHKGEQILICGRLVGKNESCQTLSTKYIVLAKENIPNCLGEGAPNIY